MELASLTAEEKQALLRMAREGLEGAVRAGRLSPLDLDSLPPRLRAAGSAFVTLTIDGALRGCVGSLLAQRPLAVDVREQAAAAALRDHRFPPVQEFELERISIEVSCLTAPVALQYTSPEELRAKLRPHVDGVILNAGARRATYLPQVWSKLPDPAEFLGSLCEKLGVDSKLWERAPLGVEIYQVEEFHEM